MTLSFKLVGALLLLFAVSGVANAQSNQVPHYCRTDVGVLGPYPNDGSVKVGDSCFGTKNGRRVPRRRGDEPK